MRRLIALADSLPLTNLKFWSGHRPEVGQTIAFGRLSPSSRMKVIVVLRGMSDNETPRAGRQPNATRFSSCENSAKIVGRTPWSARVPLDPLFATGSISSKREGRPGGRPRIGCLAATGLFSVETIFSLLSDLNDQAISQAISLRYQIPRRRAVQP